MIRCAISNGVQFIQQVTIEQITNSIFTHNKGCIDDKIGVFNIQIMLKHLN